MRYVGSFEKGRYFIRCTGFMKKQFVLFVALVLSVLITSCNSCSGDDGYDPGYWGFYGEGLEEEEPSIKEEPSDSSNKTETFKPSFEGTKTVTPNSRTRLADLGRDIYTELIPLENDVIGGIKLCSEMSADRNGEKCSETRGNEPVVFYSYNKIGLVSLDLTSCEYVPNIVGKVVNGDVSVNMGPVCSNPRTCFGEPPFIINISITNNTDSTTGVDIPYGTMLEAQNDNVQNIVVCSTACVTIPPLQTRKVSVKAMCAARRRSNPTGSKVKLTPFLLNVPKASYKTKESLWNSIENYRHTTKEYAITFYAWGIGDSNSMEGKSKFGHAFVDIPGIGVVGYVGRVTDHTHDVQYAKKSATVRVSQYDLDNAKRKFHEWVSNTPEYDLGNIDCTTFVLDIADAAHVRYGARWLIHFPEQFVNAVNFYNRWNN